MFDIFDLLTITWRFFQSFDHQSGSRWNDVNLCLTILNSQFNGYPQTFPVLSGSYLCLGSQSWSTWFVSQENW